MAWRKEMEMTAGKIGVLILAVVLAAVGQVVLKHGMTDAQRHAREYGRSLLFAAAQSPWIVGGLMIFACSAVAWLLTLSRVPLSVAYPFNALSYIAILTSSAIVLHERTSLWMWFGTLMVVGGLVIIVLTAPGS